MVYYTDPNTISEKIRRDVCAVEQKARFVVYVNENGAVLDLIQPKDPAVDIIAVVGPGVCKGLSFEKALLLEIGISRARPYHAARACHARWNACSVSDTQLAHMWPTIRDILLKEACEKISKWKSNVCYVWMPRRAIYNRDKSYRLRSQRVYVTKGVYFSVAKADRSLAGILYRSDVAYNKGTIHSFAQFVNKCLVRYRGRNYTEKQIRSFARSNGGGLGALAHALGDQAIMPHRLALMQQGGFVRKQMLSLFQQMIHLYTSIKTTDMEQCATSLKGESGFSDDTKIRILPDLRKSCEYFRFELVPPEFNVIHIEESP